MIGIETPYLDFTESGFSTRGKAVREARAVGWCAETPYGLAVLRHREVGLLLRDRRLRQGSHAWPMLNGLTGLFAAFWCRSVIAQEGVMHRQLRDLAVSSLSEAFIASLVPAFQEIAADLTEEVATRGRAEFMADFAEPFAGQAICALLGMPRGDWPRIARDASDLGLAMGINCKRHEPIFDAAYLRLEALAEELVARVRSGADRHSYVAGLVSRYDVSDGLSERALLDMIVISIFGGVDTTRSQLGLAMALFIEHPAQWHALRADPSLVSNAVEEIIRARPTTTWVTREAVEDFEFGGRLIAAGTMLHLLVHASGTDPAIDADAGFDITIRRKRHFGFGGGAHHCIGHLVARTDIAAALTALAREIEEIAYDGTPEWLPDSGNTSAVRLPLRFKSANC